ncbi:hypothetical protein AXG93_392s1520 [Marchantia polymorpha subsp. ruderalis]|uniref:FBD domain-containing protein n=1 Tax=Marchantia polymorpha subsp. ruderalis TaxID=1480154 RepID=A0A176WRY0_MARPO|nr:hypothetical protein AXG93_392s1520 [Marchantia polymorpha subsp. ruderalis]
MDPVYEEPETSNVSETDEEPETSDVSETDEEPKLPSAVQDLIRRLEGKREPITSLPNLSMTKLRKFFPDSAALSTITRWRSQVRLRVLEAIGNCNTLKFLDVRAICDGDISRCWLNLASGLRGNSKSKLQSLELWEAWGDSSAGKHVADMINSAPLLQTLRLTSRSKLDDEAVGMLSQALIQSSSLQELRLKEVAWGAALLLKALAGDDDGWTRRWQQLGEVMRDNAIATDIRVEYRWGIDEDSRKSTEALACAASSDVKDPTVELAFTHSRAHDYGLPLNLLGRVLRGEIRTLKSFYILRYGYTRSDKDTRSNEDGLESILSMNGNSGETSVLKKLRLQAFNKDNVKSVLRCLRGNTNITHFSLSSSNIGEDAFTDLMGILRGNTSLTHLAWHLTGFRRPKLATWREFHNLYHTTGSAFGMKREKYLY